MYALAIIMILWLVVGAITLPNASRWFKGKAASIQQDVVMLPSATDTTVSAQVQIVYGEWQYNKQLVQTTNVPDPPIQGLQGILYDRGQSCQLNDPNALPSSVFSSFPNVSKVALIQRGGCFFSQKLLNAQLDGASAAIVYDNITFDQDPQASQGMCIDPNTITIPALYVDLPIGLEMYERLKNLSQLVDEAAASKFQGVPSPLTRVTLYPAQHPRLDPWQFALIIIGVVIWQCNVIYGVWEDGDVNGIRMDTLSVEDRLWHTIVGGQNGSVARGRCKRQLPQEVVNTLSTRVYGEKGSIPQQDDNSTSSSATVATNVAQEQASCVICLESFVNDDVLRILPCHHEYHRDCIGKIFCISQEALFLRVANINYLFPRYLAYQKERILSTLSSDCSDAFRTSRSTYA
ncbi:hypothetical protein BJV82DRAFT_655498 [Fennellomyces sp. T-0311]|nr:hypothetical protein BJV82DRAFT_655498 [Fennellomyces sp. T-0311]